jgi:tetratricopeptide (TPR) repeat protein
MIRKQETQNLLAGIISATLALQATNCSQALAAIPESDRSEQYKYNISQLARILSEQGAPLQVFQGIERLLAVRPNDPQAHFLLSECYSRSGFEAFAQQEFELSEKLTEADPASLLAQMAADLDMGDAVGASRLLGYAQSHLQDDPQTAYMQRLLAFANGQYLHDDKVANELVQSPYAPKGIATTMAWLYFRLGNREKALSLAESELAHNQSSGALAVKALSLYALGKSAEALPLLRKTFAEHPLTPNVAESLSRLLIGLGLFEQALQPLSISIGASEKEPTREFALKWLKYAFGRYSGAEIAESLKYAAGVLDKTSNGPRYHLLLGQLYEQLLDYPAARAQYLRAIELNPNNGWSFYRAGKVEEEWYENYPAALIYYQSASRLAPNNREFELRSRRLAVRLKRHDNDIAWCLRDWLRNRANPK